MDVSQQIAAVWQARAAEIGMVWWLLTGLDDRLTAWLAPRLAACWAEMTVGYGQALRVLYLEEQAALQEKLRAEAQQAAAQAEASEQRFEELFRHAHHPVVLHENGRILAVNQAVTDAFGYPPQALVGQTMQQKLDVPET